MSNKPVTILSRIENIEAKLLLLERHLDDVASSTKESLGGVMQTLQGIILASEDGFDAKVEAVIQAKQKERVDAKAAREKEQIDALVEQGILALTDKVEADCLIIGRVLDSSDNIVTPRLQTEFANLTDDAKTSLLNQTAGFQWVSAPGSKFEILEVYKIVLPHNKGSSKPQGV